MNRIGVILNTYKRRNIGLQLEALRGQTVKPADLLVWRNDAWTDEEFRALAGDVRFVRASENMGVWPRFLAGCLVKSDFVAVFDDDTVPGCRWLESCLTCYERQPGVYGTFGRVLSAERYSGRSFGWSRPSDKPSQVDVAGHAWFFPQWLCAKTISLCGDCLRAGEDMALSFIAQQNGFNTFTCPHPAGEKEFWGSLEAKRLASDGNAISATRAGWRGYESEYRRLRGLGWRLIADG
jgi:hypothetical protein